MSVDPSPELVHDLARAVTGRPDAVVAGWSLEPVAHRVENLTTERLDRLAGTLDDGTPWSVFAKVLRPASASPVWASIPVEHRAEVLVDLDWLGEVRVYRCGVERDLPDGLRLPVVHRIDEGSDRITIWMEDVADQPGWDLDRYHEAALALGRLGGRWPETRAVAELGLGRRRLDRLFFGKIGNLDLPLQADDGFWSAPGVAAAVDARHRADLLALAAAMPERLQRIEQLPHGVAHGDATPDNLRRPAGDGLVAIDWSYGCCGPLGSDLGQLVAGRIESGAAGADGRAGADAIAELAEAAITGYVAGLAAEGFPARRAEVEEAFAVHLAVRSVFSALIVERDDLDDAARSRLLTERAALARFGLDLAARTAGS